MGTLERKIVKAREERGEEVYSRLQDRIRELEAKVGKLTQALDSDVRVIKQAAGRIQELQEANTMMAQVLKAKGLMTLDGRLTAIQ